MEQAFQDAIPGNQCWGCGPTNPHGLHLKSCWEGDAAVATFRPAPYHMAGPESILNGGIIATIIDCHCVCTAIADAYRQEGRGLESDPAIWYATARLDVTYLKPTPIKPPVTLRATILERKGRKTVVECSLVSEGEERAKAEVIAVRVPEEWRHGVTS